ncbi:hypothetical protein SH668x_002124 [Planctomicrobium sp. SH668]|uniref:hypothetical protein n=1 Tax=Planctomicrobium sp. SH668 TaxID=3448126 RepID=UPI003F5BABDD
MEECLEQSFEVDEANSSGDEALPEGGAPPSELVEQISNAITLICDGYGRGCRKFTGQDLSSTVYGSRREAAREQVLIPFYISSMTLNQNGEIVSQGEPQIVVTRDISQRGVGFRSDFAVNSPHVMAEFDHQSVGKIRFLLNIRWTRRVTPHNYLVGAFIKRLIAPHEVASV